MEDEILSADEIEAAGRAVGLSIAEVCRRAQIAQSTFFRWKAGSTSPSVDVYRRLRDAVRSKWEGME